ncbi:unnamed protein product [Pleuronectes platessa]|uniref:Uncharacterized protein n=1 Tax=Pleuronectes platessa TaxID=8262 RepID=A0A9N7W0W9_PLEPL|nr:unnamed protein product [Pleuronectes platessa]
MSSPPWGSRVEPGPAAMPASIDSPGLGPGPRQPLPRGPGEVTHTETEFRRGEQGELSRAQIRGPRLSQWRHESVKRYVCVSVRAGDRTRKQSHQTGSGRLLSAAAVLAPLPINTSNAKPQFIFPPLPSPPSLLPPSPHPPLPRSLSPRERRQRGGKFQDGGTKEQRETQR